MKNLISFQFSIVTLIGLVLYAYYVDCDPLLVGQVPRNKKVKELIII